ncbi:MAG: TonB-dependent receptor, partial [Cyclobacteriaceae bacterium]|nr:TonB-dependent receptor [Cyclobacteriaceae bacterium]
MKKVYLFLFITILSCSLQAQSLLRGKVTDASNSPLVGANIQVTGKGGTITDKDGEFSLECSGAMEIIISYVGYQTVTRSITDCSSAVSVSLVATNQTLGEVEITATATSAIDHSMLSQPVSISKLGQVEIKRGTGLFLDDAINANIPGVFMQRRTVSAGQQFNIRGYGGGGPGNRGVNNNFDQLGIKAYLNGIPITDAEGITLMDDIDFGSIGNVEVVKGPSGTLYGLAIAGVVNLQTMKPQKGKTSVGQDVMFGSYGLNRFTTHVQVSTERSSILINYGKQNFDGFMPHTKSRKDFVNVMGEFQLNDKQSLTTYLGYSDSYDERNGELTADQYSTFDYSGNPAYIKNNAHTNVISMRAGISHNYQFSKNFSNTTSVFGTGLNSNVSSAGGWTDKAPFNAGFRSVFDTRFDLGSSVKLSGITGIEAQRQYAQVIGYPMVVNNADPNGDNIIGAIRSNQSTVAGTYLLFTQWTLSLPNDLSFTAGLGSSSMNIVLIDKLYVPANNTPTNTVPTRYATDYNNLVSPNLAINKIFSRQVSAHVSFSQGYRAPVASNIYVPLGGFVNTNLVPEMGQQFEIGSKGTLLNDKLYYEAAYFRTTYSNKMTLLGVPNAAGTATLYSYVVNAGGQNNNGFELLLKYTAIQSETGFIKMVRPFANMTYSDFRYDGLTFNNNATVPVSDFSGNAVAGVPKYVVNVGSDFVSSSGLYANAMYMFRDVMPFTPDGLNVATSTNLLNAKIGFRKTFG